MLPENTIIKLPDYPTFKVIESNVCLGCYFRVEGGCQRPHALYRLLPCMDGTDPSIIYSEVDS